MADGLAQKALPLRGQQLISVVSVQGAVVLLVICLVGFRQELALIPAAIIGVALMWRVVRYTTYHPLWLPCPLIVVQLVTSGWFLSEPMRAVFHYGVTGLFCLPLLPAAWRNRTFARGGFGLYTCYFLWAAITVSYSLAPAFSAGRLLNSLMVFGALSFALQVGEREEIHALLRHLLLGCAIVVGAVAASALLLPRSLTWIVPVEASSEVSGDVARFCGIFNGPNDVGEMMLVTVGCAAALWPAVNGTRRWLLAALISVAIGTAALADSRTPFVALAVGASCYLVWRYHARAVVVMLLIALAGSALHFNLHSDVYLARGEVSTLTGRTEIWNFALDRIEQRPVTGYGYRVAGAILDNRYFPLWWGPWDEGPQSSLHNGYIDRAVGEGVPATLFWLFIVLRPWYEVLRRREDRWGLKPVSFWMVIPMLVHNLTEVSIVDCLGPIGLCFFLVWALAERARILTRQHDLAEQRRRRAQLSPAVAALAGGVLALIALVTFPGPVRAQTVHFPTLPPHAALLSGSQCAAAVAGGISWEPRLANNIANHTVPTFVELAGFHRAPIKGSFAPIQDFARVNGRFTGTTDQILRWGACKWGIDEDVVRAEAVAESHWRQDDTGDQTGDWSLCPPGSGFPGAWNGANCKQSYGIMQMKFRSFGGWPLSKNSTAFNVDFRLAYQRACMNGDIPYLSQGTAASSYPGYPLGSSDQMLWGCIGDWFSGSWIDAGALRYIAEVKADLALRAWSRPGF